MRSDLGEGGDLARTIPKVLEIGVHIGAQAVHRGFGTLHALSHESGGVFVEDLDNLRVSCHRAGGSGIYLHRQFMA